MHKLTHPVTSALWLHCPLCRDTCRLAVSQHLSPPCMSLSQICLSQRHLHLHHPHRRHHLRRPSKALHTHSRVGSHPKPRRPIGCSSLCSHVGISFIRVASRSGKKSCHFHYKSFRKNVVNAGRFSRKPTCPLCRTPIQCELSAITRLVGVCTARTNSLVIM